jgi:hypothetical protein
MEEDRGTGMTSEVTARLQELDLRSTHRCEGCQLRGDPIEISRFDVVQVSLEAREIL